MKQFKTRDSATAFMRKHGVKREHYNNFISTDVVGGKPVFLVDDEDMHDYLSMKKDLGEKFVDGNFNKEDADGNIKPGDYYNEDGSLKKDEPEEPEEEEQVEETPKPKTQSKPKKKTSPLAGSELDERARARLAAKKKPDVKHETRKYTKRPIDPETGKKKPRKEVKKEPLTIVPATKGILKHYPETPTKSIRAFIVHLILEGADNHTILGGMKEVFGEEVCEGKSHYPQYYRNQLIKAKQIGQDGKPNKT